MEASGHHRRVRPTVIDATLFLATLAGLLLESHLHEGRGIGVLACLAAAATGVTVVLRRWSPLWSLVSSLTLLLLGLPVLHATRAALVIAMFGAATIALQGSRRRSVGLALALVPVVLVALVLDGGSREPWQEFSSYLLLLLAAVAAGDALASRRAAATAREHQQEAARQLAVREMFDDYRLSLAREIHDSVAHSLVAINTQAGVAAHLHRGADPALLAVLQEAKHTSSAALDQLRGTLDTLRSDGPAPLTPSRADVPWETLVGPLRSVGLNVSIEAEAYDDLPAEHVHAAYRIVQESLTNVLRHARHVHAVTVRMCVVADQLDVRVRDDGQRQDARADSGGHGLTGMRERAQLLGGALDAGPADTGGWVVHARLPLTPGRRQVVGAAAGYASAAHA